MSENPYPGINPHLNSYLLAEGGWKTFHSKHITHLTDYLETILPGNYYTMPEDSLQITAYYPDLEKRILTEPDISIYYVGKHKDDLPTQSTVTTPTLTMPVIETIVNEDEPYTAVIIYGENRKPVTRIELLSPSNKPTYKHYNQYISKRDDTLKSGLRLVEIDFLHTTQPIIPEIPSYRDRHARAYPYMLIVSDPRPTLEKGLTSVYGFGVLDNLPVLEIPLNGQDTVRADFGEVYNTTFSSSRAFSQIFSDTANDPANFAAYTDDDQRKIRAKMGEIKSGA
ncbi:MAG: DUF4058 family protein [Aggregatilineales bacterium]